MAHNPGKEERVELQKYALVCLPSKNLDNGLKIKDLGRVNLRRAKKQHLEYVTALSVFLGYCPITMPPDPDHPDSVFVEDPAVVIQDALVMTRLRRRERRGEEERVFETLVGLFGYTYFIKPPGYLEGGDVIVTDRVIYVGISGRTNHAGADQLDRIARRHFGLRVKKVELAKNFRDRNLHLKGGMSFHEVEGKPGLLLVSEEIAHNFKNDGFEILSTPTEERFGANCISERMKIVAGSGRPRTRRLLEDRGFEICDVDTSEFVKIDGALTCLSKIFTC